MEMEDPQHILLNKHRKRIENQFIGKEGQYQLKKT